MMIGMPGPRRRVGGLTLIELVISLAILALLLSIAVPEGGRLLARWKLQAAAERLSADLQAARLDAIERGLTQHVWLHGGNPWCWSVSESPGCGCEEKLSCQRMRAQSPSGSSIVLGSDERIRFEANAEIRRTSTFLPLSNAYGDRLQVALSPTGRSRVCAPDSPNLNYPAC